MVKRLLHALIMLVGAGLGVAATLGSLQVYRWLHPAGPLPLIYLAAAYILMAGLGALVFHLLSERILRRMSESAAALEHYLDKMSWPQLVTCSLGLLTGLMIAALLSQIFTFMGESIFTTASSGILYVVLGLTGFSVGRRRSGDLSAMFDKAISRSGKRRTRTGDAAAPRSKVLDSSVLIDGRLPEICRVGFMEGELVVPGFILEELRRVADSADPLRRIRGKRGLDSVQKLQSLTGITLRVDDTDYPEYTEIDMKLLRYARENESTVVSGDANLCRVARMSGLSALNLNELSAALRPAVSAGEEMSVQLVKEGKEPGQGVGYLPDGTMIVVEGGRALLGRTAAVTVSSVLQTSAGRMIFARLKEDSGIS
ncbi:MAG: hypothetical protein IJ507_02190 [Clostridia bacterium]|nr:hypothetical protein [Clostridia bacterium]